MKKSNNKRAGGDQSAITGSAAFLNDRGVRMENQPTASDPCKSRPSNQNSIESGPAIKTSRDQTIRASQKLQNDLPAGRSVSSSEIPVVKAKHIKLAAKSCHLVISSSDTFVHFVSLGNGWRVKAERSYFSRPYRVSWVAVYSLEAPDGSFPIAGHTTSETFAQVCIRYFGRIKK